SGLIFSTLKPWEERERSTQEVLGDISAGYANEVTGGLAFAIVPNPLGSRSLQEGFQLVLQGTDFDELQQYGQAIIGKMRESGISDGPRAEPRRDKPQLDVDIDRARAAALGVPVADVASSLESLFGGRQVTQYKRQSRQYDVILQIEDAARLSPSDLG